MSNISNHDDKRFAGADGKMTCAVFAEQLAMSGDEWDRLESEVDPAVARQTRRTSERVTQGALPDNLGIHELI
jgi:hypothetical protein